MLLCVDGSLIFKSSSLFRFQDKKQLLGNIQTYRDLRGRWISLGNMTYNNKNQNQVSKTLQYSVKFLYIPGSRISALIGAVLFSNQTAIECIAQKTRNDSTCSTEVVQTCRWCTRLACTWRTRRLNHNAISKRRESNFRQPFSTSHSKAASTNRLWLAFAPARTLTQSRRSRRYFRSPYQAHCI